MRTKSPPSPTTIGFLYFPMARGRGAQGEPRPIKVIKHLYDIGILADMADDADSAITTYAAIHAEQLRFRGIDHSVEETLLDTQTAAYHVCRLGGKKQEAADELTLQHRDILGKGIGSLESHLFSEPFRQADSQIAAAKAALAAQMISSKSTDFNIAGFLATEPDLVQLRAAELVGHGNTFPSHSKRATLMPFVSGTRLNHYRLRRIFIKP